MTRQGMAVLGAGLVSALGATTEECCAAIRCGLNAFAETRFISLSGEWIIGSEAALHEPWRGRERLARMAAGAIGECLAQAAGPVPPESVPVLLTVAEEERPGRLRGLDSLLMEDIGAILGHRLAPASRIVPQGRVGGAVALLNARRLLAAGHPRVVVAGVDSYLLAETIGAYDREDRLLTKANSNGFIAGEAGAAIVLANPDPGQLADLIVEGLGFGREPAPFGSGLPLRADGMRDAVRAALAEAAIGMEQCDCRISDISGEQYRFKEAALVVSRLLRQRKTTFGLWHPADCIGETGAAALPAMLAILLAGAREDWLPGCVFLGHLGNDDDKRAAFIARTALPQSLAAADMAEARAPALPGTRA